ncbi:hypothetical protein [Brumimicrobium oceani]|uniref:Lipoprotein n=1 Tax=Brumimicrobium oceani TaxID=2100725 RepID=A0A2U2X0S7_9FLAO|nr:hypothetical protein [Brumimicrobium oceani]PWH81369.1 hypothetical protein DIT68_15185 [Brumimicrobium oceani]
MKKVLFVGMIFGGLALTSCKKDYKCTYDLGGVEVVDTYDNLDKDEADSKESQCEVLGGDWELDL